MSSTYGNTGNEGQRGYDDGNGDVNTYSNRVNEPSRHRDNINLFVNAGNGKPPRTMQADINWTLTQLHRSSAKICDIDHHQCHSTCCGLTLSGDRKVCDTSIRNDSTVMLSGRLRGG